jgi:hypothetical protein
MNYYRFCFPRFDPFRLSCQIYVCKVVNSIYYFLRILLMHAESVWLVVCDLHLTFLSVLLEISQFSWSPQRNSSLFHWFFSEFFCFQLYWFLYISLFTFCWFGSLLFFFSLGSWREAQTIRNIFSFLIDTLHWVLQSFSEHFYGCVQQILVCCVFIVIQFHIFPDTTYICPPLLPTSYTRVVHLFQFYESVLTHHLPPNILKYTSVFTVGIVYGMSFHKCIMACIHHYSIIQNNFIALKILCSTSSFFPPCNL